MKTRKYSNNGFTLIELMMVVAIVAILTLVAYPAYQGFVVKSNRAEAQSYLMHLAQAQQLYFNDARVYAADVIELDTPVPDRVAANYDVTDPDFFTVTAGPPPTFILELTPKDGTAQADYDVLLSINNAGEKRYVALENSVEVEKSW